MRSSGSRLVAEAESARRALKSTTAGTRAERAFLVGLDYRVKKKSSKSITGGAQAARDGAVRKFSATLNMFQNLPRKNRLDELKTLAAQRRRRDRGRIPATP